MELGKVTEIWRYPVKSLGGEMIGQAHVAEQGICGDRAWALVDEESGDIASAKNFPRLLEFAASYGALQPKQRSYGADVPHAEIICPGNTCLSTADKEVSKLFSDIVGRDVRLAALEPAENLDHYRLSRAVSADDIARQMNIKTGEEFPDFAGTDPELMAMLAEYACPPGTYSDAYALHLMTTASMDKLRNEGGVDADRRRFRPNLVVESANGEAGFVEFDWVGKTLRLGSTLLRVDSRTVRCAMPARAQPQFNLSQAPAVSKALYNMTNRYLGVNITVLEAGVIAVGDSIILESAGNN